MFSQSFFFYLNYITNFIFCQILISTKTFNPKKNVDTPRKCLSTLGNEHLQKTGRRGINGFLRTIETSDRKSRFPLWGSGGCLFATTGSTLRLNRPFSRQHFSRNSNLTAWSCQSSEEGFYYLLLVQVYTY